MATTRATSNSYLTAACKVVLLQLSLCTAIAAVLFFTISVLASQSFLVGAAVVALPNFIFAYHFFRRWRTRSAKEVILSFYVGEVIKMILSAILAIFFIKLFPLKLGTFIVGMVVAYLIFWIMAPIMMQQTNKGRLG